MVKTLDFNWILKLDEKHLPPLSKMARGEIFEFVKERERIYPIGKDIFLVDNQWNALAIVYIRDFHLFDGITSGNYIISDILDEKEKEILTSRFRKMYMKNE